MAIELVSSFLPLVDEQFTTESKAAYLTNKSFEFTGAHAVKIYKISTGKMYDYARNPEDNSKPSRYGEIEGLDATTEEFVMKRDRSFTYVIDTLDKDETAQALDATTTLERQIREVVIPEVDTYTLGVICEGAGTKPEAKELTPENLYKEIIEGSRILDNAEVPEMGRILVVTPDIYYLMKQNNEIIMQTEVGEEMRQRGVIGLVDGMEVLRVPAVRLPEDFGFMIVHPCATVAPMKLQSYRTHEDPPGISGQLVEGRIVYDAFVLENKAKAIYYQTKA